MTVGETLAEARNRAGLSVDELGQRTKIRAQVIRAIEQDDFDACGGTLYVRGYVRVIAGELGVDAQSLLRELDRVGGVSGGSVPPPPSSSRPAPMPPRPPQAPRPPQPPRPAPGPASPAGGSSGWGAPPTPVPPTPAGNDRFSRLERLKRLKEAEDAERAAAQRRRSGPMKGLKRSGPIKVAREDGTDPGILDLTRAAHPTSVDLSRAGSSETLVDMMRTAVPGDSRSRGKKGRRSEAPRAEAPMVQEAPAPDVVPGMDSPVRETSFDMPALGDGPPAYSGPGFGTPAASPVAPAPPRVQERRPLQPPPAQQAGGGSFFREHRKGVTTVAVLAAIVFVFYAFSTMFSGNTGNQGAAPPGGPSASASPSGPAGLTVSQCQAYGPNGTADGDNPSTASYPITPGSGQPWITQQYSSAQFGGQKSGSGLLLDMGKTVTVSGVSVDLGSTSGAGMELQAGNSPASLSSVSTVTNVSGNVQIRPGRPVTARYLLVWFTQLPQASDGQYQASVYHISVQGNS